MANSKLATYKWSGKTDHYNVRDHKIDKITIHHMAGNLSLTGCCTSVQARGGSCNYCIDSKGNIGVMIDEQYRAWTTNNRTNDMRAVTIEVANDSGEPNWHVSDKALAALIDLCVDICKRNGIKKLNYTGNKSGNLTMHKWYWATACPGPYLSGKFPYIASEVNKRLSGTSQTDKPASAELYRVRKSWSNASSQIGAYSSLDNAKKACKSGYSVFDSSGKAVYTKKSAKAYTKGTEVKLSNVMLYVSATAKSGRVISGTYYIYDNMVNKGRMRITNKKTNCGRSPVGQYVTGWVNKSDI